MSTVEDKKNIKRLRLLDAAYNLFIEKSVNSTAIDEVVKAAGVAKGTFYLYFRDKYDLLDQIIARKSADVICDAYNEFFNNGKNEKMDFTDEVVAFVDALILKMDEKKEVLALIDKNLSMGLRAVSSLQDKKYNDIYTKLINEFTSNGFSLQEANKTLYLLIDIVGNVCLDTLIYNRPYSIDEIRPTLLCAVKSIISGVQTMCADSEKKE